MDPHAERARIVNAGLFRTFAVAVTAGMFTFVGLVFLSENLLGLGFAFIFLPAGILAGLVTLYVRGRVGGKWLLSAFRQNKSSEHYALIREAKSSYVIDLPADPLYKLFGPSSLVKHELERYFRKANEAKAIESVSVAENSQTRPESIRATRAPSVAPAQLRRSETANASHSSSFDQLKPTVTATYKISRVRLLHSLTASLLQVFVSFVVIVLVSFLLLWLIPILLFVIFYFLYEKHWTKIKHYLNKDTMLSISEAGITILYPEGPKTLQWHDIIDVSFRYVALEDEVDDQWMQISTNSSGLVSTNLQLLDIGNLASIEVIVKAWSSWMRSERIRTAMER